MTKHDLALMSCSVEDLVQSYLTAGERGGEAKTQEERNYYKRRMAMVEAIGNYRFPGEFSDKLFDETH